MFFRITKNDISPAMTRLIRDTRPPKRQRILRAMGTTFKSLTEGTFNSAGAEYRPEPWPAKKDGSPSNLQKSTTLAKSFNLQVDDNQAKLSNPTKYAAVHQFGSRGHVLGKVTGRVKTKYATARFKGSWNDVREGGSGTPPRPFYPVKNNKLTPAAEEKIARAARRVLDSIASGK